MISAAISPVKDTHWFLCSPELISIPLVSILQHKTLWLLRKLSCNSLAKARVLSTLGYPPSVLPKKYPRLRIPPDTAPHTHFDFPIPIGNPYAAAIILSGMSGSRFALIEDTIASEQ